MKGLRQEDLVNQDLITELRKEFGMTYDEFYMVLTDTDMRVKLHDSEWVLTLSGYLLHIKGQETRYKYKIYKTNSGLVYTALDCWI
ncbi:hypothetical protein GOODEAATRI_012849 [Goodea atripinnis]|uniref:Coiled-coil domain-containing protein 80 n=1 Tax=Goodea atripinnis TaxID=208336 RepID=A0ABV0MRP8_9TELE